MPEKLPSWKKFLSYFRDVVLEKRESDLSGTLTLLLSRGRLKLDTDCATYSYQDLYTAFAESFEQTSLYKRSFNKVLLLGFGLGSIVHLLERNLKGPKPEYVGVEKDAQIIELVLKHLPSRVLRRTQLIEEDALKFKQGNNFNLIVLDVFIHEKVPDVCFQVDFWNRITKWSSPDVEIFFNTLPSGPQELENVEEFFQNSFQHFFSQTRMLRCGQNLVLYGRNLMHSKDT